MSTMDTFGLILMAFILGFIGGCVMRGEISVDKFRLKKCGYEVHEYTSSKDGVETNWVEVVRTDGRPL